MIRLENIHKRLGSQHVLRGVSLEMRAGETLVIIGRSGGGKSVLLRHMVGLLRPDSGAVYCGDVDISRMSERQLGPIRRKVGILFQNGALFDSMTVAENVAFPLVEGGEKDKGRINELVAQALDVVSLNGQQDKMPVNLSGGMKKRVALARAIVTRPTCILYDEPTAGLDPIVSDSIDHLIRNLQTTFKVTSIVVTHDMKSVFHIADRVAYLLEGKIYFSGTPDELKASDDPLIQDFIEGRSGAQMVLEEGHWL